MHVCNARARALSRARGSILTCDLAFVCVHSGYLRRKRHTQGMQALKNFRYDHADLPKTRTLAVRHIGSLTDL